MQRVKSVIRRRQAKGDVSITVGNLLLYPDKRASGGRGSAFAT